MADDTRETETSDTEIKEIRDEYRYATDEKSSIREEGDTDMRYIGGDPWEPEDRQAREDANRPVITADELSQYVNQLINDVRQNKRAIKVAPAGSGATDKTAELRQSLIRQIEYRSNAALDAYPIMFENSAQRSYGYLRIKPEFVNHRSFDQELRILPVPNPNMVTEDPNNLRPDGADWKFLYFAESWLKADVKRKWKGAKFISFDNSAMQRLAPDWVKGERMLIAERWRIVTKPRELLMIQRAAPTLRPGEVRSEPAPEPEIVFKDELDLARLPLGASILKSRMVDYPTVKQQIVNGVEILEEKDFPGTSIPFVSCYGKVLYIDDGSGPKKQILSLIRLARSPFMLYCYYRTQQAEMAGMIPKVPVMGYKGQFANVEADWQKAAHEPLAYLEAEAYPENWPKTGAPAPLPQRLAYSAGEHLQALELCAEGARRAIQAAIGASPLPTQAQRQNEKSGIALKQIEDSAQKGSFHFIDHFDGALTRTGTILDELIPHYYDAAREVTVRQKDDQPTIIRINDPEHEKNVGSATEGMHDVTISVGPRQISEREAASDFADSILGSNLMQLMGPDKAIQIAALAIRLKNVGPIGDEMADLLAPKPPEDGKLSPQQVADLQRTVQMLQQQVQEAQQALETDKAKHDATLQKAQADNDSREKIAAAQLDVKREENETRLAVAELGAKVERMALFLEERARIGMQDDKHIDRAHQVGMAAMGAQHQADAADLGHQQALEAGDVSHGQQLEAGEIEAQRAADAAAAQGGAE